MRILVLSNLYPPHYVGGYELRCQQVTEALRQRGHEVLVLTSDYGVNHQEPAAESGEVIRTLRLHGFFGRPWLGLNQLRILETHNNRELRRAIDSFRPELVHVWNLGGISKSLLHTLERLNLPTVFDVSDHWIARSQKADVWLDWWNRKQGPVVARAMRFFFESVGLRRRWDRQAPAMPLGSRGFRRLYFCSAALRRLTQEAGFEVGHGAVIHCGVNTRRFCGEPVSAFRPLRRLLYVGRLAEDKGTMTALRALATVKDFFSGELRIYGKGDAEYTHKLHSFASEHQLPVTFHHATQEEMPKIYQQHDALIFTSEWEEPFALTPLEAMASGLPVIGTTTGGSAELFRHGENSLTYPAGNATELAQRLLELNSSGVLRHQIATQGQKDVIARCSEPVIMSQIENYLQETLATWAEGAASAASLHREPGASRSVAAAESAILSPILARVPHNS